MITIQSLSDWTGLGMLWELKKDRKDHSLSAFEAKKRTKTGVFWSLWGQNLTWKFTFFENLTKIWLKSENESVFWSLEDTNGPFWMPGGSIYPSVRVRPMLKAFEAKIWHGNWLEIWLEIWLKIWLEKRVRFWPFLGSKSGPNCLEMEWTWFWDAFGSF